MSSSTLDASIITDRRMQQSNTIANRTLLNSSSIYVSRKATHFDAKDSPNKKKPGNDSEHPLFNA